MSEIQNVIDGLRLLLDEVPEKLARISEEEISHKPAPGKWSKKEILGHLCDSCFNNIQRLVRVEYEDKPFIIYQQDEWVKIEDYQNQDIADLLSLWMVLHKQFIQVLNNFPDRHLESMLDWGSEVSAHFVITDYLDHQHHHLKQIIGR
jgi:hypothetical protein